MEGVRLLHQIAKSRTLKGVAEARNEPSDCTPGTMRCTEPLPVWHAECLVATLPALVAPAIRCR